MHILPNAFDKFVAGKIMGIILGSYYAYISFGKSGADFYGENIFVIVKTGEKRGGDNSQTHTHINNVEKVAEILHLIAGLNAKTIGGKGVAQIFAAAYSPVEGSKGTKGNIVNSNSVAVKLLEPSAGNKYILILSEILGNYTGSLGNRTQGEYRVAISAKKRLETVIGRSYHFAAELYVHIGEIPLEILHDGKDKLSEYKIIHSEADFVYFAALQLLELFFAYEYILAGSCNMTIEHLTFGGKSDTVLKSFKELAAQIRFKALYGAAYGGLGQKQRVGRMGYIVELANIIKYFVSIKTCRHIFSPVNTGALYHIKIQIWFCKKCKTTKELNNIRKINTECEI